MTVLRVAFYLLLPAILLTAVLLIAAGLVLLAVWTGWAVRTIGSVFSL